MINLRSPLHVPDLHLSPTLFLGVNTFTYHFLCAVFYIYLSMCVCVCVWHLFACEKTVRKQKISEKLNRVFKTEKQYSAGIGGTGEKHC